MARVLLLLKCRLLLLELLLLLLAKHLQVRRSRSHYLRETRRFAVLELALLLLTLLLLLSALEF